MKRILTIRMFWKRFKIRNLEKAATIEVKTFMTQMEERIRYNKFKKNENIKLQMIRTMLLIVKMITEC